MIRLVAFDIDDTLTRGTSIWEMIYRILGTWETVGAKHLDRFLRDEIDYNEFARADTIEFAGNHESLIIQAAEQLDYAPGMLETFEKIHELGITTALVSSSIQQFADWLGVKLSVPHVYANPMIIDSEGFLTGEIRLDVPCHHKDHIIRMLRDKLGISKDEVLAVGDSILDFTMFDQAGKSCCVAHAPDEVKSVVSHILPDDSLLSVLDLIT